MVIEKCAISGLEVQKDKWSFTSRCRNYYLTISIVGDDIYVIKPMGNADINMHLDSFHILEEAYSTICEDKKAYIIHDYSEFKSTDMAARRHYTRWVLKNIHKTHLVIFSQVNRRISIMVKTGKFMSRVFDKVQLKKDYKESLEHCLRHKEEQFVLDQRNEKFDLLWEKNRKWLNVDSKDYKLVKRPEWKNRVSDVLEQETYFIDGNISVRRLIGTLRKDDIKQLGIDFYNYLDDVIDEGGNVWTINDLSELKRASLSSRKETTQWFLKSIQDFEVVIFCNISPIIRAGIKYVIKTHSELKNKVHIAKTLDEAIELAIALKYKKGKSKSTNNKLRQKKKDLRKENEKLKMQLKEFELNQNLRIEDLIANLGRVTWDENFKEANFKYENLNDPFADLYATAMMIVSDIKEMMDEKEELLLKAQSADKIKSAFLANMSHEIRTPLNSILGFTELLLEREDIDDKTREYLTTISTNGEQLLYLINDILNLSRIESEQIKINFEPNNLNDTIEETIKTTEPFLLTKENVSVKKDYALKDSDCLLIYDHNRLKQVLINLMNNAIKFTDKGSITVGYKIQNNQVIVYVEDTGIGISEEDQKLIFERFSQAKNDPLTYSKGVGLGLAITKQLVELMRGEIWVESEEEKGTKFYFTIPFKQSIENLNQLSSIEEKFIEESLINRNLLIIDNNDSVYYQLHDTLIPDKNKILRATNVNEAKRVSREEDIDLIFISYSMNNEDFIELVDSYKQENPYTPLIVLVNEDSKDAMEKIYRSRADNFITLPIAKYSVLRIVSVVLE